MSYPTKHLVCFEPQAFSVGKRIEGNKAPTLCGQTLEFPRHQPFFYDDPTACQTCLERVKFTPGIKYPMFEASP